MKSLTINNINAGHSSSDPVQEKGSMSEVRSAEQIGLYYAGGGSTNVPNEGLNMQAQVSSITGTTTPTPVNMYGQLGNIDPGYF